MIDTSLERLPDDIEALLDSERRNPESFEDLQPIVRAGLQASLPLVWPVAAHAPLASGGLLHGPLRALARRLLLPVTFGLGAGSGAVLHARLFRVAQEPPPATLMKLQAIEPPLAPLPPVVPEPSAKPKPQAARPSSAHVESKPAGALAEESLLLEQARTALARGNGNLALEALSQDRHRFPRGPLAEEREALRIQALVQVGRGEEARVLAQEFRATYPKSPLEPAVEATVRAIP